MNEIAAQSPRWRLWTPVAFGLGAALYMTLRFEPPLWAALAPALLLGLLWIVLTRLSHGRFIPLALVVFLALGFAAGKIRTERVAGPIAPADREARLIEGWVVDVASPGVSGGRLLIAPVRIQSLDAARTPSRIRVTVKPDAVVGPGSAIRLRAIVGPPPPPASPGSYDFARDAFFDGIGGVGFALGEPTHLTLAKAPWRLRLVMDINAARWSLARRIVARLGPDSGGVAAAMITGHEAWITPQITNDMRASGLAHILSISGLHMAIVGGFAFAAARLMVAAWPWLALRVNGKKVAAGFGLVAVVTYLVISGAPPPAERAAITATVAFLAILFDRRAISLHALAVAALAILVMQPEAACAPGFQMSFAATAALVALAESWPRPVREINTPWWIRAPQAAGAWLLVSLAASFVAGLATGPFAMHHFNRVAVYGLGANLAVAPLSSFIIMPGLALGGLLEPAGLGGPFLAFAGWGIDAMNAIAAWTAALPGAQTTVPSGPGWTLAVAFFGVMWLCLWRGWLRWLGLPMALTVLLWPRHAPPDLWISPDGNAVAIREGGRAVMTRPTAGLFAAGVWSRRRGLDLDSEGGPAKFDCNRSRCLPVGDVPIAQWIMRKTPSAAQMEVLCADAELIVLRGVAPEGGCPGRLVLDGEDFAAGGAAELYRAGDGWRIVWATPLRGRRPWTVSDSGG